VLSPRLLKYYLINVLVPYVAGASLVIVHGLNLVFFLVFSPITIFFNNYIITAGFSKQTSNPCCQKTKIEMLVHHPDKLSVIQCSR